MKFQRIEDLLLIYASRADNDKFAKGLELIKKNKDLLDWAYIIKISKMNFIIPQIYTFCEYFKDIHIPKKTYNKLKFLYYKSVYYSLTANYTLKEITNLFRKNKINFLLIKGHSIAQFYPSSFHRHFLEIDVLVPSEELFFKASKKLIDAEYKIFQESQSRRNLFQLNFVKRRRLSIDLHKELVWGKYQICKEKLFQNRNVLKFDGLNILTVSPEANILFICSRLFESGYFLIRDVVDVAKIITNSKGQFKWNHLLKRAEENYLSFPLLCLLYLTSHVLQSDLIPKGVFKQLHRGFFLKLIWALLKKTNIDLPILWNSPISKIGLLYGNFLKSKRDLKFFALNIKRSGFGQELRYSLSQRIKHPLAFHYLRKMLIRK